VFDAISASGAEALMVLNSSVFNVNRNRLVGLAARHRLPAIYEHRNFVNAGGLMSYGPDLAAMYERAARYVDRLLRGANPADLPIEQPTKFELIVNLKTAKAMDLTVPPSILLQATEVIE